MIDLTKKKMPSAVLVDGIYYRIKTDFRYWIRFNQIIEKTAELKDFDFLYAEAENIPTDKQKGLDELFNFYNPKAELPRIRPQKKSISVFNYVLDADLLYAAFYQQYGINLIQASLHWHEFRALLAGLRETKLSDVISYRLYEGPSGKKTEYDRSMENLRFAWEIKSEESEDDKADLERFNKLIGD